MSSVDMTLVEQARAIEHPLPVPGVSGLYGLEANGQSYQVTDAQLREIRRRFAGEIRHGLNKVQARVTGGMYGHAEMAKLRDDQFIVSRLSEMMPSGKAVLIAALVPGGAAYLAYDIEKARRERAFPDELMWVEPSELLGRGRKDVTAGHLDNAAEDLGAAEASASKAVAALSKYREGVIEGAGSAINTLEVTRDVSFATVGIIATVATGGAAGAAIGAGVTATGTVAQQAMEVNLGMRQEIDWAGISFDAVIGLVTAKLGGKLGEAVAGRVMGSPAVAGLTRKAVATIVNDLVSGEAASFLHTTARALFDNLRGASSKMSMEEYIHTLAAQLTDPTSILMNLLQGEVARRLHRATAKPATGQGKSGPPHLEEKAPPQLEQESASPQLEKAASLPEQEALQPHAEADVVATPKKSGGESEVAPPAENHKQPEQESTSSASEQTPALKEQSLPAASEQTPATTEPGKTVETAGPEQTPATVPAQPTAVQAPMDPRIAQAQARLKRAANDLKGATERNDAAAARVAKTQAAAVAAEIEATQAKQRATAAATTRDAAEQVYADAPAGQRNELRKQFTAAKNQALKADQAATRAAAKAAVAKQEHADAVETSEWRKDIADRRTAKEGRATTRLGEVQKLVSEGDVPRLQPGEAFTKEKWRPNFGRSGPEAKTARGKTGELPSDAVVRIREDPITDPALAAREQDALKLASTDPQEAGNRYAQVVGESERWGEVSESFREKHGRIGRRWDFGNTKEITIEGRSGKLGDGKLDQLWFDLNERGSVDLTVPKLSPEAERQLARLAGEWQKWSGREPVIRVRVTAP
jgi:hypothetical protein